MMHGQHPAGWTLTAPRHVLSSDEQASLLQPPAAVGTLSSPGGDANEQAWPL